MIIDLIRHVFTMTGHQWRIGGRLREPSQEDIRAALDEAAIRLYPKKNGTTLSVGGLIIEKTSKGFDVYVRVGEYK